MQFHYSIAHALKSPRFLEIFASFTQPYLQGHPGGGTAYEFAILISTQPYLQGHPDGGTVYEFAILISCSTTY